MDLIIRQATIIDGVSTHPCIADVGIIDDIITRVGNLDDIRGKEEYDAHGQVLSPGFIDLHGHSDFALLAGIDPVSKLSQGITSEVIGCCGFSLYPRIGDTEQSLASESAAWGISGTWSDTGSCLRKIRDQRLGMHVIPCAGHGTIREAVAGANCRYLDDYQREQFRKELQLSLDAGCFGMSLGLAYTPGIYSDMDELIELSSPLDPDRHYVSCHLRCEGVGILRSIDEIIEYARRTGLRVLISHLKIQGHEHASLLEPMLERLETARDSGVLISADAYPYTASCNGLQSRLPAWARLGDLETRQRRLRDPLLRSRLKQELRYLLQGEPPLASQIRIARVSNKADHHLQGLDLAAAFHRHGGDFNDLRDWALALLLRNEFSVEVHIHDISEEVMNRILDLNWTMVGTDSTIQPVAGVQNGLPHPRAWGTFPRLLRRAWRQGGMRALVSQIIRMTRHPADWLRLAGRGRIAPGYHADLVVLDPDAIADLASFEAPRRTSQGIRAVFVNGREAWKPGSEKVQRNGKILQPPPRG